MTRRSSPLLAIASSLLLLATACGGSDDPGGDLRTGTTQRVTTTEAAAADTAAPEEGDPSDDSSVEAGSADDSTTSSSETTTSSTEATTSTTEATEDPGAGAPTWPSTSYRLFEVASLEFPIALATRPGSDDLYVSEREGRVRRIDRTPATVGRPDFALVSEPTLDVADLVTTAGEGGLLGLTFSADGQYLYASYTDNRGDSVLAEYRMDGDRADPSSARILSQVEQPFSNHNGGQVERGPDGLLWWALGDGGSGGDPLNSGQDTSTLLGSILRIDPANRSGEQAYGLPADNPFADGEGGRPEIWLYGVRNPWRFAFDPATDDLWIGDVGQNAIEEITLLSADGGLPGRGANLGWRLMEGDRPFDGGSPPAGHAAPIYTYDHSGGACSVTGGPVYRGQRLPALDGVYLFGDFCTGRIVGLERLADGSLLVGDIVTDRGVGSIVSFGQDSAGEVYVLGSSGSVSLLEPAG